MRNNKMNDKTHIIQLSAVRKTPAPNTFVAEFYRSDDLVMQLASIVEKQLLAGDNLACIGDEIVQFQQAVLQQDNYPP